MGTYHRLFRTISCTLNSFLERLKKKQELSNLNKYLTVNSIFTQNEHLFLQMIAEEIAFAIRNAKIFNYVVNSYCKQRQGLASCKGCKGPLGSWTPCVKYQNLSGSGI